MGLLKIILSKFVLFLIVASLFQSCSKRLSHKFEFYEKINKTELDKIKINGIYYSYKPKECVHFPYFDYTDFFIFYGNGYFLNYGVKGFLNPIDLETAVKHTLSEGRDYRKSISLWGSYVIKRDSLFLQILSEEELWIGVHKHKAKIVDDSTLYFNVGFCQEDKSQVRTFNFQRTKSKPDSINAFMTNKTLIRALKAEKNRRVSER